MQVDALRSFGRTALPGLVFLFPLPLLAQLEIVLQFLSLPKVIHIVISLQVIQELSEVQVIYRVLLVDFLIVQ